MLHVRKNVRNIQRRDNSVEHLHHHHYTYYAARASTGILKLIIRNILNLKRKNLFFNAQYYTHYINTKIKNIFYFS